MRSTAGIIAAFVLVVVAALVFVFAFRTVVVLFAGTLFGLTLRALARGSARVLHAPYRVALVLVVALGLGTTIAAGVLLAPEAEIEFNKLTEELPAALEHVMQGVRQTPIVRRGPTAGAAATSSNQLQRAIGNVALAAVGNSVEAVAALFIIFFIGVYSAAQPGVYERALLSLLPPSQGARAHAALHATAENLTRWLLGRLVAMLFVGVTTTIAFHLLEVPLAVALGIFAGLLTFVEYAGALISGIPPVLFALAKSPASAVSVLALYTVLHVIEGYVLTPLLSRVSVRVPPAIALSSQALLGTLMGPLGLTFSTPLLVVVISTVQAFREEPEHVTSA
jgi:predicted PurR-regulated permease PerM